MTKANLKLMIDMNIDLPEGDTEITEQEKCAIIDRIHGYLTQIGTTSDDYEGCLAGEMGKYGIEFELLVKEVEPTKVIVNVSGGVVQGARSNVENIEFDVFDEDNKEAEGIDSDDINSEWEDEIPKKYPYGIY